MTGRDGVVGTKAFETHSEHQHDPVFATQMWRGHTHKLQPITPQRPQRGRRNLCWFLAHAFPLWPPALNLKTSYTSNPEPCQVVRRQTCTCT